MYDPVEDSTTTESDDTAVAGDGVDGDDVAPVSVLDPTELLASIDVSRESAVINAREIRVLELTDLGRQQAATVSAAQALMVRTVAGLIADGHVISGCTMGQYVVAKWGLQRGEADRLVRLAKGLVEFSKVAQAFYDGQISELTCDLIVRKGDPSVAPSGRMIVRKGDPSVAPSGRMTQSFVKPTRAKRGLAVGDHVGRLPEQEGRT